MICASQILFPHSVKKKILFPHYFHFRMEYGSIIDLFYCKYGTIWLKFVKLETTIESSILTKNHLNRKNYDLWIPYKSHYLSNTSYFFIFFSFYYIILPIISIIFSPPFHSLSMYIHFYKCTNNIFQTKR